MAKQIEKKEAQDGEIVESYWDVKKIGIGFFVLILLLIVGSYLLRYFGEGFTNNGQSVLGTAQEIESEVPPLPDKDDIESIISNAQNTLSQITSENLTSSQAAIQKIISDLQSLQSKEGAMGVICSLVCRDK